MSTAEPEKSSSPAEVKKRADSGNHIIGRLGSLVSTSLSFSEDEDDSYLASTLKAAKELTKCTSAVTNIFQLAGHIHLRIKYITPKIVRAGKLMVRGKLFFERI